MATWSGTYDLSVLNYKTCMVACRILIRFITHISLASFLWEIGKQNRHRCDAAKCGVPSGAILFAYKYFIKK